MSDTANPAKLASAEEFDARLRRTDEARWLATRYAPPRAREGLVAIYLFHQELRRTLHVKEPMLGKIRLQWWRETLEQIAGNGALRRHDLAEELARVAHTRRDVLGLLSDLVDRFDDVLDDHLATGHSQDRGHEARHLATEGALMRLAGQLLDSAATSQQLDLLARAGEARIAMAAQLSDAAQRWSETRVAVRSLAAPLWPALLHLVAGDPLENSPTPLATRWRMFQAALLRRL